ncbi:MAG: hypothetical protein LUE14_10025 [Clostridiales bacterium]|nr:hypothetical protein [Clostridiales bacterium]
MAIREFIHTDYDRPTVLSGQKLNPELRMIYDFDTHSIIGTYPYFQEINFSPWLPHRREEYVPGWIDPVDGLYELHQSMPVLEEEFHQLKPVLEAEAETKLKTIPLSDTWYIDFLYDGHDFWLIDMSLLSSVTRYDRGFFNFPSFD